VKTLGLTNAWSEGHTFDTIADPIAELRVIFPNADASMLRVHLKNRYNMQVSRQVTICCRLCKAEEIVYREVIGKYLKTTEPDLAAAPISKQPTHHMSYAVGVNHFWVMGKHDKWKHFGLFWHGCLDGFTGKILWLVVWWNNSNPKFVCAQYFDAVRNIGGKFPMFFITS
jgi:hypothetical protein